MNRLVRQIGLVAIFLDLAIVDLGARGPWVTIQNCHFLVKRANDGDSFHVSSNGEEHIFRLYFVDAPETDSEFRDRVDEQAQYFGITAQEAVSLGILAKNYTREKLSGPFTVRTCWEDAMGRSRMQRFYAIVQTNNGDLGEQLVENGLARIHGFQASPEGTTSAKREWQRLNQLQQKAKREKIGGWGVKEGRMMTRAHAPESTKGVDPFGAFFHPEKVGQNSENPPASPAPSQPTSATTTLGPNEIAPEMKLDVNTASQAELENVSGIGPVKATRIIEARPFKSADDLRNIKGIGDKLYAKIRPYFK